MGTIVQKYGGTSVDGREKLLSVAKNVAALRSAGNDVVVVVSAPGLMTDGLIRDAHALAESPSQRELDMLMTAGERVSMSLLSIALNAMGCPAVSFTGSQVGIITDTRHTDARILEVRPFRVIQELAQGNVVVVGGFQGVSTAKDVTTLGRGGSDTTAVVLAAALGAERCEILTDVAGVYTADPNLVPASRLLEVVSYEDMHELARLGASVLKEDAVTFAERHGIKLIVKASGSDTQGTIVLSEPLGPTAPITGLSLHRDAFLARWRVGGDGGVGIPRLDGNVRPLFTVSTGGEVLVALDETGSRAVRHPTHEPAELQEVALLCAVGPGAGTAETVAAAAGAITEAGGTPLVVCAGCRSIVLALERNGSTDMLRSLHALFFEAPGGQVSGGRGA
jgi:uridylate kinase